MEDRESHLQFPVCKQSIVHKLPRTILQLDWIHRESEHRLRRWGRRHSDSTEPRQRDIKRSSSRFSRDKNRVRIVRLLNIGNNIFSNCGEYFSFSWDNTAEQVGHLPTMGQFSNQNCERYFGFG